MIPKSAADLAKLAKDTVLNNKSVAKVVDSIDTHLQKVEDMAKKVGLDDELGDMVDKVESKIKHDIDKDGSIGAKK